MDGLGDRPIASMNGKTPLEAACTPYMDYLAAKGMTGLMHLLTPGVPVGTDVGHVCIFGYDPALVYSGRGPIEAAGAGVRMFLGDIAFRGNFATVDSEGLLIDKRAGRIAEGTADLAAAISDVALDDDFTVHVKEATEHRAVVIFSGPRVTSRISNVYPSPRVILPCPFPWSIPQENTLDAAEFASVVNNYIRRASTILQKHPVNIMRAKQGKKPANTLLLRGPGSMPHMPSFVERFEGLRTGIVVAEETVLGLGLMAGMTVAKASGMTGSLDTDYTVKAKEALRLLIDHDLVFLHIKGTDLAGHDNLPQKKKSIIESVDYMLSYICESFAEPLIVAVGSDHSTPCALGEHSGDPVPILLSGLGLRRDSTAAYNETAAMNGGLGHMNGRDFLHTVLNAAHRVPKQGA